MPAERRRSEGSANVLASSSAAYACGAHRPCQRPPGTASAPCDFSRILRATATAWPWDAARLRDAPQGCHGSWRDQLHPFLQPGKETDWDPRRQERRVSRQWWDGVRGSVTKQGGNRQLAGCLGLDRERQQAGSGWVRTSLRLLLWRRVTTRHTRCMSLRRRIENTVSAPATARHSRCTLEPTTHLCKER